MLIRPVNSHVCSMSLMHSTRATENHVKLKISRIFHKKLTMPLKITKFINKHLKLYIQKYNYVLKQQWLFLKYHNTLLVLKHPIKYFKKPTANHVRCCSMQCFIYIVEKWHIVKPGTVEKRKT